MSTRHFVERIGGIGQQSRTRLPRTRLPKTRLHESSDCRYFLIMFPLRRSKASVPRAWR